MIRVYLPNEKVPRNRYIYGLYAKEGKDALVINIMRIDDTPIFGDLQHENTSLVPVGFVMASDMMKLLKDNMQVSLSALTAIGKAQAVWHTPAEK